MIHGPLLAAPDQPQAGVLSGLYWTGRFIYEFVHHPLALLVISLMLAVAYGCAAIATKKGRNARVWGILGFLFSVVTLIVLLLLPSKRSPEQGADPGGAKVE